MWRFLMALAVGSATGAADPTLVNLSSGAVWGVVANHTLMWRGIPYAQAPTGERRWRSPLPAKSWAGVKEAKAFAPACAQLGPAWTSLAPPNSQAPCHNNMAGCVNWTWSNATSEDCLYANVYRSSVNASQPRPVVVYFAAGAFEWGSANDQENSGEGLGVKPGWQDVVFVTLNYRKGIFGFLASEELKSRDERKTAGNFGLQDQSLGLQWVKQNIAAFGGDPARVTLFGESAGATSVSMHLVMPDSRGLFHGAMIDSGAFNQWTYRPWSDSTDLYATLVEQLGCDAWKEPLDCMLSKPTEILLNISDTYYGNCSLPHKESLVTTQWAPSVDGVIVPDIPRKLLETGRAAHVPVLLGSNLNEGSTFITGHIGDERDFEEYFNKTFGETSGRVIADFYKPSSTPSSDPYEAHEIYNKAAQDAAGDFDLRCPTMMAARTFASLGQPTYLYSFDHQPFESVNCEFLPCPTQSFARPR